MAIETIATATAIPANLMAILRQSHDARERMLDWVLAIGVSAVLVYAFRDSIAGWFAGHSDDPNTGRAEPPKPDPDADAWKTGNPAVDYVSYNMPRSRAYRWGVAPIPTLPPRNRQRPPIPPVGAA